MKEFPFFSGPFSAAPTSTPVWSPAPAPPVPQAPADSTPVKWAEPLLLAREEPLPLLHSRKSEVPGSLRCIR